MKTDQPDNQNAALDNLLNELSFEPENALAPNHQAPKGLRQRILQAQQQAAAPDGRAIEATTGHALNRASSPTIPAANEPATANWFRSPWRAIAASAAPLLLGILLGSNSSVTEFYSANIDAQDYPDDDQLLVIASLDSDFTASIGLELPQDWAQDGETPNTQNTTNGSLPGANTP